LAFIELAMKWVIVALKDWEIGVALPQVSGFFFFFFCMKLLGEEKLGDAKYWGVGLGGGEGGMGWGDIPKTRVVWHCIINCCLARIQE
jgi:hypothetical protein